MLFQCWTKKKDIIDDELKYTFMFTEDDYHFEKSEDNIVINEDFEEHPEYNEDF